MAKNIIDATLRFVDKFTSPFRSAVQKAEQNTRKLNSVGKTFQKTGKSISQTGKGLTTSVTLPIVAIGGAALKTAADFEKAMDKVQSISNASSNDMVKLSDKAREMGAKTKFSASEAADAFSYMAMAGWKTQDMLDGIEGVMYLAGASGENLATTSDIVTDALTAFGLTAKDTNRFVDVLAAASNNANTNVSMLGESFKYCAPLAGAMKYSTEDTAVALGMMANSGIKASQAGTALRSWITRLAKPTKESGQAMKDLGISITDSKGKTLPFMQVMERTRDVFSTLTDSQKAQYAAMIAGKTGMSGLLAIANASEKDFTKLCKAVDKSNGAARKMYDIANSNFSGQFTILKSTLESIGISFGQILLPYANKALAKVQGLANKINSLSDSQKKTVVHMLAFAAAVGPTIMLVGKLTSGVGGVIIFISQFAKMAKMIKAGATALKVFSACTSVASLGIIAGIVAVVAIVVLLIKNWDKVKAAGSKVASHISKTFNKMGIDTKKASRTFNAMKNSILKVVNVVNQHMPQIQKVLGIVAKFIAGTFLFQIKWTVGMVIGVVSSLIQNFTNIASSIQQIFNGIIKFFTGVFTGNWKKAFSGLGDIVKGVFSAMVGFVKIPLNTIIGLVNGAINGINNISITIPKGIPKVGGKHIGFSIPSIPMLYRGTNSWGGGPAEINEPRMGGEIVNLPSGSKVIPHDKSLGIAYNQGKSEGTGAGKTVTYKINIEKLDANDDSDVERVCKRIIELLDGCEPEPA